jgi:chemotaxis protein MotA
MADESANKPVRKVSTRPDFASIGGLCLALLGIVGGLLLEKGKIDDISQYTAAVIVLGGTFGAVLVSTPLPVFIRAIKRMGSVMFERSLSPDALIEEIIGYATKARKNGLVSLEQEAEQIEDPFLRKALTLAVDGTDLQEIRKMLELEMSIIEHHGEEEARVFEGAGGYAPTIGIIGAVMGLIQVMKHLEDIAEVGRGIAVAFVATVYGVGLANIFLLPAATKIKARNHASMQMKELVVEGVAGIVEGLNPKLIRSKLEAYAGAPKAAKRVKSAKGSRAGAPAPAEG